MKTLVVLGFAAFAAVVVGCTVTNGGAGGGGSADAGPGTPTSGADGGEGGSATPPATDGGEEKNVIVSTAPSPLTFGACPTFEACGGDFQGTFDYTGGCIEDPFAAFKKQCPSVTTKDLSGTIVGTVNIVQSAVYRNGKATFTGTVTIPSECTMGATCAQVQAALASAADSISCTGTTSCDCVVTGHWSDESANQFTQTGNTVTLDDGNTYDVCVKDPVLSERQTNAGANAEPGVFQLTRRR